MMTLNITECSFSSGGKDLLFDLYKYGTVSEWVEAILDGESAFHPLTLMVSWKDHKCTLITDGTKDERAEEYFDALCKCSDVDRRLPNDKLRIVADPFEQDLYIYLGSK